MVFCLSFSYFGLLLITNYMYNMHHTMVFLVYNTHPGDWNKFLSKKSGHYMPMNMVSCALYTTEYGKSNPTERKYGCVIQTQNPSPHCSNFIGLTAALSIFCAKLSPKLCSSCILDSSSVSLLFISCVNRGIWTLVPPVRISFLYWSAGKNMHRKERELVY